MIKYTFFYIIGIFCFLKFLVSLYRGFQTKNESINLNSPTKNLIALLNITNYNMVRFVDYENLEFNSLSTFKHFRKKYFNISYINYYYDEINNVSKLEYILGIFDEDKNFINSTNQSKIFRLKCFQKLKNNIEQNPPQIIDDKYYKCVENFNSSEPIKFGVSMFHKKAYLKIILDFGEVLKSPLLTISKNVHQNDTIR